MAIDSVKSFLHLMSQTYRAGTILMSLRILINVTNLSFAVIKTAPGGDRETWAWQYRLNIINIFPLISYKG